MFFDYNDINDQGQYGTENRPLSLSSKQPFTEGLRVRDWLAGKPFEYQSGVGEVQVFELSFIIWAATSIFVSFFMILSAVIRLIRYSRKAEKPVKLLSFREEKIWLCSLVVMLSMSRYLILHMYLFQNNPNPALNSGLLNHYFLGLLLSLVWPAQLPDLIVSIVILVINRVWMYKRGALRRAICFHKALFIGVCVVFLLLVTSVFTQYHLGMITLMSAYTRFLLGKCFAEVLVLMSLRDIESQDGTGDGFLVQKG